MAKLAKLQFCKLTGRGQFRVPASALNDLQMEAVKQGLQRRFSVVQGPPGTGGDMRQICEHERQGPKANMLIHWNHL